MACLSITINIIISVKKIIITNNQLEDKITLKYHNSLTFHILVIPTLNFKLI